MSKFLLSLAALAVMVIPVAATEYKLPKKSLSHLPEFQKTNWPNFFGSLDSTRAGRFWGRDGPS